MVGTPLRFLLPLLLCGSAAAEDVQTLVFHASFGGLAPEAVTAMLQVADARREIRLVDDGSDPRDARGDRVYTGSAEGLPVQYLPVVLTVDIDGKHQDVYNGTLRVGMERTVELAFEVSAGPGGVLQGVRRASSSPGRMSHATEAMPLLAASFWAIFVLVYGAIAIGNRNNTRRPLQDP